MIVLTLNGEMVEARPNPLAPGWVLPDGSVIWRDDEEQWWHVVKDGEEVSFRSLTLADGAFEEAIEA